jgi:hypothetical protein
MPSLFPVRLLAALTLLGLAACGGTARDFAVPGPLGDIYQATTPAVPSAKHAQALEDCTFNPRRADSCPLTTLPFLGQDVTTATVDAVMERVATTHPWMAQRFREVLQDQPPALLQMFRSTTAIIIGSKVRPSFYWPVTGAIYLDPEDLWLTQAERATIDMTPDFRSDFGRDLQFRAIWRYVKNNDYAYDFYPESFRGSRTIGDIRVVLGRLLVHELAHAGDFMPPASLDGVSRTLTAEQAINAESARWVSERLKNQQPLASSTWRRLAQVMYADAAPTAEERALTPAQAGQLAAPDRASDAYGYFTQFEDMAMLAEEALAWCFYGVQRDFATSNKPTSGDFIIGWGVRSRVSEPAVEQAARFVTGELLPGVDLASCYASLPEPEPMRPGATWTANLDPDGDGTAKSGEAIRTRPTDSQRPAW